MWLDSAQLFGVVAQVYMMLPTCEPDSVERMKAVHARTDVLKNSPAPFIQHWVGNFVYGTAFGSVCWICLVS